MDLGGKVYIGGWAAGWAGCQGAGLGWLGLAGKVWESLGAGNASLGRNI